MSAIVSFVVGFVVGAFVMLGAINMAVADIWNRR